MIKKRISKLRDKFLDFGIDGYIVPKNDEFFSEYSQKDRLKTISNFNGSAGFAIILKRQNYLFVDGRYTIQAKIESGKAPLQLEILIRVCRGFQVWPSAVMATAERYSHYLGQRKWSIVTTDLPPGEDDLLREAQEYWSSPGGRNAATNRWGHMPVLNGPQWNMDGSAAENTASAPFRFAVDPWFRSTQMAAIEATGLGF